ncbi:CHAT domain-containing protein [Russula compacta]|nr:CHAT domain-containing protein [Russula compacta]
MADPQSILLQIEDSISYYQNILSTLPRSRPHCPRSMCLSALATARLRHYALSDQNEELEKAISHCTEAVLLPFAPQIKSGPNLITTMFDLAEALLFRSLKFKQLGDLEHCIKYLHYLRDQSLESYYVTRCTLAARVQLESIDPMWDIREIATLCHELLSSGVSEALLIDAVKALVQSIYDGHLASQVPPDEVIECLREARIRLPNLKEVSPALVLSLGVRHLGIGLHDDYKEAMSIVDEMIADPSRNMAATKGLAGLLAQSRLFFHQQSGTLEEAIFRTRNHLNVLSSEDPNRRSVTEALARLEKTRFEEFGVTSSLRQSDVDIVGVVEDSHMHMKNQDVHLRALRSMIYITDLADIEKAIEYCRLCITSPHSYVGFTLYMHGELLFRAFRLTKKINCLDESITVYRELFKTSPRPISPHDVARPLITSLFSRFRLLKERRDLDEIMRLFAIAVADTSREVPRRFKTSCEWMLTARDSEHPSTPIAYENSISLMQESLSFAPTLHTQHFRLVTMRDYYEMLPLDHASYLVHIGQLKQAIETLERGRGLLWSEMRGLRTSIDQLGAVNMPLAENFMAINRDLEALTMSNSPGVWMNDCQVDGREEMDPFGRLVMKQQKLVQERDGLISQIRAQPGFDTFLIPPSFNTLRSAASRGPVIIINHSKWRSDIIILLYNSPPSLIPMSNDFYDRAEGLKEKLLATRKKGLESREYEDALRYVLETLHDLVGRPLIQRLHQLNIPEQSRVWWCPTSVICSLPLHAMGPIRSDGRTKLYFSDMYITSYTPTLSALIESHKPSTQALDEPSMLLVVQPDAQIPSALQEMRVIQNVCPSVEALAWQTATPSATLKRLREHRFAHISCHGILETGKPFDAFFELYGGTRLTLLDVVRSQLPSAEFAFLSACHTAEITEQSVADEGLHLSAAVQYSGFRSVVGTMWAMADIDGPVIAESFYKSVFSDRWQGKPYHERTAEALRDAVRDLRRKRGMTLERWVNFVHHGA